MRAPTAPAKNRELGQHFLDNPAVAEAILAAACVQRDESVIEVGPGTGALTRGLADRAKSLVAIEIDPALASRLRSAFAGSGVKVLCADALEALPQLSCDLLISNTPYAIAEALIRLLPRLRFSRALLALPGPLIETLRAPAESATSLTVFFQLFFSGEAVAPFPAQATEPPAPHDGAVLRILPRPAAGPEEAVLRELLLGPGRTLKNGLREALIAAGLAAGKREGRALAGRVLEGVPVPLRGRTVQSLRGAELAEVRENLGKCIAA